MASENSGKKKTTVLLVFLILAVIFAIIFFIGGAGSVLSMLKWFVFYGLVAVLVFLAAYVVYHLFVKPQKIDITWMSKQKLIASAKLSCPPMVGDLYVSGDSEHQRFPLGKIVGWTRIQVLNRVRRGKVDVDEVSEQDVFVVQTARFPLSLFSDPAVIRVAPSDHSRLVGDVVLFGFSLIKLSEYFYLNHETLNIKMIDYNVLQEAKRGVMFLMLADLKQITDDAIGINPQHNISMQQTKMMPKIPQPPTAPPAT